MIIKPDNYDGLCSSGIRLWPEVMFLDTRTLCFIGSVSVALRISVELLTTPNESDGLLFCLQIT